MSSARQPVLQQQAHTVLSLVSRTRTLWLRERTQPAQALGSKVQLPAAPAQVWRDAKSPRRATGLACQDLTPSAGTPRHERGLEPATPSLASPCMSANCTSALSLACLSIFIVVIAAYEIMG